MMRQRSSMMVVLFVLCCTAPRMHAQTPTPTYEQLVDMNSMLGKEFWIAIPPNDIGTFPRNALEVYVTSPYDAVITVTEPETQRSYTRTIKAGQTRTLTDAAGETQWFWELYKSEEVLPFAVHITSTQPISVSVLNSKNLTSDGYVAIPAALWDTNHIVVSYYDFNEIRNWAGGFVIIAKEDNTQVSIDLKGTGSLDGRTAGGRQIGTGKPYTITMDKGTTYMVMGDGLTRGLFDLTGTSIRSTKPVGVLGFHQRTTMPNLLINGNGRNHLVEMIPPVSAWGRSFAALEFQREHNGAGAGDMFRIVSSQPNTRVTFEYFNKVTKQKLGGGSFTLKNEGDFIDFSQSSAPTHLVEGTSVWKADKPIFLMQYSCSSSWDNDINLDPFMVCVTPLEQYCKATTLAVSTLTTFSRHRIDLLVRADTSDPNLVNDLKSLEIDGTPCWSDARAASPKLLFNRINGTDLYWTGIDFQGPGTTHTIKGNGKISFAGAIYGYGQTDAYGWPIPANCKDLGDTMCVDTIAPTLTSSGPATRRSYTVAELRPAPVDPSSTPFALPQCASGIADVGFVSTSSYPPTKNMLLTITSDPDLSRFRAQRSLTFTLEFIDRCKPAAAYFFVRDWAGNTRIDSLIILDAGCVIDTMPPVFEKHGTPALLSITATEKRNIPDPPRFPPADSDQVETGLADIRLVEGNLQMLSENYELTLVTASAFPRVQPYYAFDFTLRVVDTTRPAKAYYIARDWASNTTIDSIRFTPTATGVHAVEVPHPTTSAISIFPHPAETSCRISWNFPTTVTNTSVRVIDMQGRPIWEGSVEAGHTELTLSVADVVPGTYLVTLSAGDQMAATLLLVR